MTINILCPKCRNLAYAAPELAGGTILCPRCGETLPVPVTDSAIVAERPTTIACPGCGSRLRLTSQLDGKNVRCNKCAAVLAVSVEPWSLLVIDGGSAAPMSIAGPKGLTSSSPRLPPGIHDRMASDSKPLPNNNVTHELESEETTAVDCENCGATLRVSHATIGNEVRCPHCDNAVSTRPPSQKTVIFAFSALAVLLLAFLGVVVYECYIRDTWARDNYSMLVERLDEAKAFVVSRKDKQALEKYDELLRLVGNHAIDIADLEGRLAEAREQQKRIVAEQEEKQRRRAEAEARREQERIHTAAVESQATTTEAAPARIDPVPRRGQIDWAIAEKARRSWQGGNFRTADRAEQGAAILVIQAGVRKAVHDPLDCEATLDYIERNIDSW